MAGYRILEARFYAEDCYGNHCGLFNVMDDIAVYLQNGDCVRGQLVAIGKSQIEIISCDDDGDEDSLTIKHTDIESVEKG